MDAPPGVACLDTRYPRRLPTFGQVSRAFLFMTDPHLVLFLLHRVVDRLSDDLAVLDQVRVYPVSYHDFAVLVGPLQESHPSLDGPVGVLEGAMLGQLFTEHVRQLPYPLVTVERSPVYEDHNVL